MKVHTVPGGGGVKLHVRECGSPIGIPILLIHGWSQNHLCWMKQYESELQNEFRIVALDLRGHGMSDAAPQPEQYTDGDKWADDIAAIMDQLALDRPILVSWSYGHAPSWRNRNVSTVNSLGSQPGPMDITNAGVGQRACPHR
jgi:non-heme chloroperoxidase